MTPEQLSDVFVAALADLVSEGVVDAARRRPVAGAGGAPEGQGARRLRHERRPPARQAGRTQPARPRHHARRAARPSTRASPSVEVAGPGFLNVRVAAGAQGVVAADVVRAGEAYGTSDVNAGRSINLEFISANPTGPLHLGHTRWAAVGDAIARVLRGHRSVRHPRVLHQRPRRPDGQVRRVPHGPCPRAGAARGRLPRRVRRASSPRGSWRRRPSCSSSPTTSRRGMFRDVGYQIQLAEQRAELDELRTHFDVWFSERSLHEGGRASSTGSTRLREQGHLYEADGATWMRTTDFGDDKDRVLVRSDGELTYFASDTAYYVNKRERGFDPCIYLLGADHHGYVGRLAAMAACVGDTPGEQLQVLIGQLVKIMQNGEELKLSKRAGTMVTLRELIDLIGVDPLRYTLIRYPVDSPLTLDVAEMTSKSNDNPVYYVQYAHARLASILRNAADLGVLVDVDAFDPSRAGHRAGGRPAARARRVPARRGAGRPSCASRTASRATSRTTASRSTSSTTPAACCRRATRRPPTCTAPGSCWSPPRVRCSPTVWRCSASPHRSGCSMRSHEAGALHGQAGDRGPAWLRVPEDANELVPHLWAVGRLQGRRRAHRGGGVRTRTRRRVRHARSTSSTRTTSAPAPERSATRSEGADVFYAGKAFLCVATARWIAEEGPEPRRVHGRRAGRRAARRVPAGPHRDARQQQVGRRAAPSARGRRRAHHRRLHRGDRPAGRSSPLSSASRRRSWCASRAGVEAHTHEYISTSHEDQKFGFSIIGGDAIAAVRRVAGRARPAPARPALAHRIADLRHRRLRGGRAAGAAPARRHRDDARRRPPRARPRRRVRHRLHDPGRPVHARRPRPRPAQDRRRRVRRDGHRRAAARRSSRAAPSRARPRSRCTRSAPPRTSSSTAGRRAATSRSTAA